VSGQGVNQYLNLKTDVGGTTLVVTLDRPPVNAVSQAMYGEIRDPFGCFDEQFPDVKAVIITGAGRHFCAGNDLDEFMMLDAVNAAGRMRLVRDAFAAIYDCPVPVIGAVHGAALGTGLAIAACCDVIVAAEDARFGVPEVGVGVLGGARHLSRLVPQHFTRLMYLTAEPVGAAEIAAYGGIALLVPDHDVLGAAQGLAGRISRHSKAALRLAKESLNSIEFMDLKAGYEFEQRMTGRLVAHPDAREAMRALRQGRTPRFSDADAGQDEGEAHD
jgi:enoyl-CoA hydratase